jgi:Raf kinase inhibitor-like YbhB/YbcL family protein
VIGALAASGRPGDDDPTVSESPGPLGMTLVLLVVGSLAACSTGGTASIAPAASPSARASLPAASVAHESPSIAAASPSATGSPVMRLTSSAFADGGNIPRKYSCDGKDVSPPLAWDGVPGDAKALVLIVDDPDARGFVHWIVFDIPAATAQLPEGASASDASLRQGTNSFGKAAYGGPCPPSGTHHYRFRLFAVGEPLGLAGSPTADKVLAAVKGNTVAETTLTGLYRR